MSCFAFLISRFGIYLGNKEKQDTYRLKNTTLEWGK